jgi:hypothetical protein
LQASVLDRGFSDVPKPGSARLERMLKVYLHGVVKTVRYDRLPAATAAGRSAAIVVAGIALKFLVIIVTIE